MHSAYDEEDEGASSIYCLNYKTRCIASQTAQTERNTFLIGTSSLKDENEIHMIEIEESGAEPALLHVFPHQNEVWDIAPSPVDTDLFFTCHNHVSSEKASMHASLWRIDESAGMLQSVAHLEESDVKAVLWKPESNGKEVATINDKSLSLYNLQEGDSTTSQYGTVDLRTTTVRHIGRGAWNPLFTHELAVSADQAVRCYDTRSSEMAWSIDKAHGDQVRDLAFSTCSLYTLATGGDDGAVKFWDYRHPSVPINVFYDVHSHWVWKIKFNPVYGDQLLLSCSTDNTVNLWNVHDAIKEGAGENGAPLIKTFDEHEDSIYDIAWSAVDPWVFASLSYDGRAVICEVPPKVQMDILLANDDGEGEGEEENETE